MIFKFDALQAYEFSNTYLDNLMKFQLVFSGNLMIFQNGNLGKLMNFGDILFKKIFSKK